MRKLERIECALFNIRRKFVCFNKVINTDATSLLKI